LLSLSEPPAYVGHIRAIEPDSLAARLGLQPGDEIMRVNDQPVEDVIDVQFYAAEDTVAITYRRAGGEATAALPRVAGEALGIEFTHPTFDTDIRRCNNLCPFCFVLQTAPRMRRTLYIKDDDYRYSFLYGHYVTLTNLAERDWWRIEHQRLSPLYVSVHSTDLANRRACLANPTAPDILAQLRWLAERRIEVHTQLVITPGLNDGAWLVRSLADLADLYPTVASVSVVPVGLTKHHKYGHRAHTRAEAEAVLDRVAEWQARCRERWGVRFAYPTDEWFLVTDRPIPPKKYYDGLALEENGLGMVRGFLDEWRQVKREIKQETHSPKSKVSSLQSPIAKHQSATLVTGQLFEPTLRQYAAEFAQLTGWRVDVVGVANERLGRAITVAGLLMGQDVIDQLRARELGEIVVLPRVMVDHPQGISLDDVSPLQIARALDRPIFLADSLGDVWDAFRGQNPLRVNPTDAAIPPDVMRAGGWAVEKYL
jgi:putative radical SAM enzyme (TIGR03279 family)